MKIIIPKHVLMGPLQKVAKAASKQSGIPILSGVYLRSDKRGLTLIGTDMDFGVETFIIPDKFSQFREGAVVIAAKEFVEIIKKMPDTEIQIEVKEDYRVHIKAGKASLNIGGMNGDEYPDFKSVPVDNALTLKGIDFKSLIQKTTFAAVTKLDRPELGGVSIQFTPNKIQFTAASPARAARTHATTDGDFTAATLINARTLEEISSLIYDNEDIKLSLSREQFKVESYDYTIHCRTLLFSYKDIASGLTIAKSAILKVDRKSCINAIEIVQLTSDSISEGGSSIRIEATENELIFKGSGDFGNSEDSIEMVMQGKPFSVSTNSKNLLETLKVIDHKDVEIRFSNRTSPLIIQGAEDEPGIYAILPYRTVD